MHQVIGWVAASFLSGSASILISPYPGDRLPPQNHVSELQIRLRLDPGRFPRKPEVGPVSFD